MNRKAIAVVVVLMWVGGFLWMMKRNYGGDVNRRLTFIPIRIATREMRRLEGS